MVSCFTYVLKISADGLLLDENVFFRCEIVCPQGYIDIEEAVDRLREKAKTKDAHPLLHRLISILEDLKAFVSSRGVIEKEVALSAIYRFINEAGLSCPIYGILRGPSQSLMTAFADYGNGFLENEPFYRGSYVPHGVQTQLQDEDEDVAPKKKIESCFLKTPTRDDAVLEPEDVRDYAAGHWGPVDAPLYVHAEVSRARRDQKISLLRQKTDEAFKAAHPFKPALHRKARRMKKSTPASPFEDSAQSFSDEEFMKLRDASSRYKNKKEKADDQAPDTKDRAQKQTLKAPLRVTFDDDDDEDKPLAKTQSPSRLPAPCDRMPLTCKSNRIIAENEKEFDDKAPGHWETLLHYVVHAGEPPPPKAIKWEDSLRVRGMAEAIGNSDNENDVQQCIFDYWSNKETAKKLDKHQNRMSSRFGWTPKLAFTPSTRSARKKKTPKTRKDAAGREVFHRPYVLDHCYCFPEQSVAASKEPLHISLRREALHSLLASTPQGCRETSTAARRAPKQQSSVLQANANESTATARQQRVTSCRLTQKKTSDLFSESPEMDLLLLPQTPEKSYHIDGRNERSAWGDIVTEQKFSSRGASEWIHHLRRGHSNHPIKTSYT